VVTLAMAEAVTAVAAGSAERALDAQ
jgi:hypothetical protein